MKRSVPKFLVKILHPSQIFVKDFTHGENDYISTSFSGGEFDYFYGTPTFQNTYFVGRTPLLFFISS